MYSIEVLEQPGSLGLVESLREVREIAVAEVMRLRTMWCLNQ